MPTPKLVSNLAELPDFDTVGIVIGIDTRVFTTLAVASAARHLGIPLLLVDGYSNDGSFETLQTLDLPVQSFLIRMQRRVHGLLIDVLMRELRTKRVLLIDSDVEVKSSDAFRMMTAALDTADNASKITFASGYAHGDHDMTNDGMPHVWFPRRPWIPFALFDRERCVELLDRDRSTFEAKRIGNEFPIQWIANLLLKRGHFAVTKGWQFNVLKPLRRERRGARAAFYIYDTGGLIYEAAEQRGWTFADIGGSAMAASVEHYEGATRRTEQERWRGHTEAESKIIATLRSNYGIELDANEVR
jgi:hypothetical protein